MNKKIAFGFLLFGTLVMAIFWHLKKVERAKIAIIHPMQQELNWQYQSISMPLFSKSIILYGVKGALLGYDYEIDKLILKENTFYFKNLKINILGYLQNNLKEPILDTLKDFKVSWQNMPLILAYSGIDILKINGALTMDKKNGMNHFVLDINQGSNTLFLEAYAENLRNVYTSSFILNELPFMRFQNSKIKINAPKLIQNYYLNRGIKITTPIPSPLLISF